MENQPSQAIPINYETLDEVLSRTSAGQTQLKILRKQRETSRLSKEQITTPQVTTQPDPVNPLETEKLESEVIPGVKKEELVDLVSTYTSRNLIDDLRTKFIKCFRTNLTSVNIELDQILDSYIDNVIKNLPTEATEAKKIVDNVYSNLCAIEYSLNLQNNLKNPVRSYKRLLMTIISKKANKNYEPLAENKSKIEIKKEELKKEDYRGMSVDQLFDNFSAKNNDRKNELCFDTIREKFSHLYVTHKDDKAHLESDLNWLKKLSKQVSSININHNTYVRAVENMIKIYEDRLKEFKPWWKKLW